jgi:membrane-associated phospholipid phosphatase
MKHWIWKPAISIALLAAVLFACLAAAVTSGSTNRFDLAARDAIHSWASPQVTYAMRGVTQLGSTAFLLPLGIIVVWRLIATGRRQAAVLLVVAAVGGEAWDQGLKHLFHRPRPEAFFGLPQPENYSFPSGHSMASACFYGALAMIAATEARSRTRRRAIWAAAAALVGCVGLSRIYLGLHYPSDVLGGYLAALAWLALLQALTSHAGPRSVQSRLPSHVP